MERQPKFAAFCGSKEATSNLVPVNYVADILAIAVKKAQAGMIYNLTNPSPATNYDLLTMIKNELNFNQLAIIENVDVQTLTPEEQRLNGMISVFNAYLSRSFNFDDSNTQQLIEGTATQHLDMNDKTMQMINAYFNVRVENVT